MRLKSEAILLEIGPSMHSIDEAAEVKLDVFLARGLNVDAGLLYAKCSRIHG